jgi:hypothetical protein
MGCFRAHCARRIEQHVAKLIGSLSRNLGRECGTELLRVDVECRDADFRQRRENARCDMRGIDIGERNRLTFARIVEPDRASVFRELC